MKNIFIWDYLAINTTASYEIYTKEIQQLIQKL